MKVPAPEFTVKYVVGFLVFVLAVSLILHLFAQSIR